ncbi:hypothetical protein BV20DRAFT_1116573 [Pilatotrama ljubarskyi]|nr:hypothetical protein BV20DRAFT_1116573 [Pilatotrama ljubarskyi]
MSSQVILAAASTSFGEGCAEREGPSAATVSHCGADSPAQQLDIPECDRSSSLLPGPLTLYILTRPDLDTLPVPEIETPAYHNRSQLVKSQPPPPEGTPRTHLGLPAETSLEVFGYVARVSQRSLADATAVCSSLHGTAEEALYKFPELLTIWAARKFASVVSSSPERARAVRGLRLCSPPEHTYEFVSIVREAAPKLERLHTLDLVGIGDECVDEDTAFQLFKGLEAPSLRRIRGRPLYLSPRVITALQALPQLEELRMYACTTFPDADADSVIFVIDGQDEPRFEILEDLPNLRALSCPADILAEMKVSGKLTSLCITEATRGLMADVVRLFGTQLVSLRVERRLRRYLGLAYPTNWFDWRQFPRLKFLDVCDKGRRAGEIEGQVVRATNLPPALETLVWGSTWVLDCALLDSRTEGWRRQTIREFAETVLRRSTGVKTVIYRWTRGTSYKCILAGEKDSRCYRECLADRSLADEDAWANAQ